MIGMQRRPATWRRFCFLGVCAVLLLTHPRMAAAGRDVPGTVHVGGRTRRYLLHRPPRPAAPGPLVILLHGDAGNPRSVQRITGMDALADQEGWWVVYPQGSGWMDWPPRSWNAGTCCGYARNARVDDVAFIRALIEALERAHPIDPARIYAAGLSNGGMMAHRLACELSDRLAAVAVVAGALTVPACAPAHPVPVLMIHGTADRYVPYEGGRGVLEPTGRLDPPVETVSRFWVSQNGCTGAPSVQRTGRVTRADYPGCAERAHVVLYTIDGGGHAWPGGRRGWRFGAPPAPEVSATRWIHEFFVQHVRQTKNL